MAYGIKPDANGFEWDPKFLRCVVGVHGDMDSAMRCVVAMQLPETGADLLPEHVVPRVRLMLADPQADARALCRLVLEAIAPQIRGDGSVVAAPLSLRQWNERHRPAPFHQLGWMKQGHMAAAALIAAYSGETCGAVMARMIVNRLRSWQTGTSTSGQWVPHLWFAGDPKARWADLSEWWAWVDHVLPFEDATQAWNTAALRVLGGNGAPVARALSAMAWVAEANGWLVPSCASPRSGRPEFGRFGVLYSTEQSARVAMALRDMGTTEAHARAASRIEERLVELERTPGKWPAFVDGEGRTVYPLAAEGDARRHAVPAAITYDANKAVATPDFAGLTDKPAQAVGRSER